VKTVCCSAQFQGLRSDSTRYGDDRADFDKSMFELEEHCKQFVSAKTSMLELCVRHAHAESLTTCCCDSMEQNWTENPFLQTTVPCSSQVIARSENLIYNIAHIDIAALPR
jgi:hypothetical protein